MAAHLAGLPRREPTVRYLTNTRGRATTSAETVLDDLAQACAEEKRWDFLLTVAPLVLSHGTGTPVNPIAVF